MVSHQSHNCIFNALSSFKIARYRVSFSHCKWKLEIKRSIVVLFKQCISQRFQIPDKYYYIDCPHNWLAGAAIDLFISFTPSTRLLYETSIV